MSSKNVEIENKLIEFIAGHAEVNPSSLNATMLIKNTGIDSIGIAELMFDIEEHYNIELDSAQELQDRFELGTISDLAGQLAEKLEPELEV
ncbi:MAG: acyl carrier protein [Cellvibrionaceae bacterium]